MAAHQCPDDINAFDVWGQHKKVCNVLPKVMSLRRAADFFVGFLWFFCVFFLFFIDV